MPQNLRIVAALEILSCETCGSLHCHNLGVTKFITGGSRGHAEIVKFHQSFPDLDSRRGSFDKRNIAAREMLTGGRCGRVAGVQSLNIH